MGRKEEIQEMGRGGRGEAEDWRLEARG